MSETVTTTPEIGPGIHQLDDAIYHALPYASKHALDVIDEWSPRHLQYKRAHPTPPTDAMRFGSAFHTSILEPAEFEKRHPIIGQCGGITGKGTRCKNDGKAIINGQWTCGVHGAPSDSDIGGAITNDEAEQIKRMADAIRGHKAASAMLDSPGTNETAVIWDQRVRGDEWTHDVRCKLKADALRPEWAAVVDVKTAACASRTEFERAVATFNYHRQAAYYQDGLATAGIKVTSFVFIVVEKLAPYGVQVFRLQDDAITLGREENEKLLRTYAACDRLNDWWGYEQTFLDVSLPVWAFRRKMAELTA